MRGPNARQLRVGCLAVASVLGLGACSSWIERLRGSGDADTPATAVGDPLSRHAGNRWAESTRRVLLEHCGKCHDGDRSSSLPRALAVYNLREDPWYPRITGRRFDGILRRVKRIEGIAPEDVAAVEGFVRCARDGRCEGSAQ